MSYFEDPARGQPECLRKDFLSTEDITRLQVLSELWTLWSFAVTVKMAHCMVVSLLVHLLQAFTHTRLYHPSSCYRCGVPITQSVHNSESTCKIVWCPPWKGSPYVAFSGCPLLDPQSRNISAVKYTWPLNIWTVEQRNTLDMSNSTARVALFSRYSSREKHMQMIHVLVVGSYNTALFRGTILGNMSELS